MKKVSELTGVQLDYWVARALGYKVNATEDEAGYARWVTPENHILCYPFEPSKSWSQGGPIIEDHGLGVAKVYEPADGPITEGQEYAAISLNDAITMYGPKPLVAAMRVFVASKYGEEVPVGAFI